MLLEKETDGEKLLGVYKWKGVSVSQRSLQGHIFIFPPGLKKYYH